MIVIAFKPGRLANRLILYANFIAYVSEYGGRLINPSFDEYSPYFRNTAKNSLGMYPKKLSIAYQPLINNWMYRILLFVCRTAIKIKFRTKWINYIYLDLEESLDINQEMAISSSKVLFVHGWLFRANSLIRKHQNLIRNTLEPIESIKLKVQKFISKQREHSEILVGIHLRRGDYKDFKGGMYYYDYDQYKWFMRQMKSNLPNKCIMFIICSDESLSGFQCQEIEWTPGPNHLVEDLYVLSECDYILGPPSTYSTWASFYGKVPLYHIKEPDKAFDLTSFKIDLSE